MPAGPNKPEPIYVVFSPVRNRVFMGDRANRRIVIFDARDFTVEREIPAGSGVFHMWASNLWLQLWAVNDVDKTITVIDIASLHVVATIPTPPDLAGMAGRPHDVILDPVAPFAYVTILGADRSHPECQTPEAARVYAMVTVAMYDAVNGIDMAARRGREHALVPASGAPVNGNRAVTAASAAHAVLLRCFQARWMRR